eukprot:3482391-Rhodomonas_salina.1
MMCRLSFLTQPGGYERIEDGGDAKRKRFSHAELPPDTPFDPGFLTLYFIQIYSMQLILQACSSSSSPRPRVRAFMRGARKLASEEVWVGRSHRDVEQRRKHTTDAADCFTQIIVLIWSFS